MSYKQALLHGGLALTSAFALCAITAEQSQAGILTFTNQADFLNAIQPGFYLNNFASLPKRMSEKCSDGVLARLEYGQD
jgi:hypothetical protein